MKEIESYKNSGNVSIKFLPTYAVILLIIIPILSIAYAYTQVYFTHWIVGFIVFVVALLLLFFIGALNTSFSKIRNMAVSGISAIILFLWFYYLQWSVFVYATFASIDKESVISLVTTDTILPPVFELALVPNRLWIMINMLGDSGFRFTWSIEFLGFLVLPILVKFWDKGSPYSEKANQWHDDKELNVAPVLRDDIIKAIYDNDYKWFENLQLVDVGRDDYCKITLYISPADDNYISVIRKVAEPGTKGDVNFKSVELIKHVAINKKITDLVLALKRGFIKKETTNDLKNASVEQTEVLNAITQAVVPEKATIIAPELTEPEIIIKVNEGTKSKKLFWSIFELLAGIIFLILGVITDHSVALVFGGFTIFIGLVTLVSGASKSGARPYAIKLNPSNIIISDVISSTGSMEVIPLVKIRQVSTDVSRDGNVSFTIIFNNMKIEGKDYINLDIEMAKVGIHELSKKLNSIIGKSIDERLVIIKNWYMNSNKSTV